MTRFCLAQLTVLDHDPPSLLRLAAETGYDAAGIRILPVAPGAAAYPLADDPVLMRETRTALADTGIPILDVEIVMLTPQSDPAGFRSFFAACAEVGARHILTAGYDPDEARLIDTYAAFCAEAAPFGLTADLEFMPWTAVPNLSAAVRIATASGAPNAGVLVDALHFARSASTVAELASVPRALLHYGQLCDAPAEIPATTEGLIHTARCARLMPGEGGIDLTALIRALPDDLPFGIEIPNDALAARMPPAERVRRALDASRAAVAAARAAAPV